MEKRSRLAVIVAVLFLVFAMLACQVPGSSNNDDIVQEVEETGGMATSFVQTAPTLTLIPTFTPRVGGEMGSTNNDDPLFETSTSEPPSTSTVPVGPMINQQDGAYVVFVPDGEFIMGNNLSTVAADERPEHSVYLDAFWLYETTVTNRQYRQCISAGACEGSINRYSEDDLPAVNVSWFDAMDYCTWAGGRLPTEAEWEKGARGTDGRLFPWGDSPPTCDQANYKNCYNSKEIPVGMLPAGASPYGALDMVGNVWEWIWDWYDSGYYAISPDENPTGPASADEPYRVQRGGSFESNPGDLYVTLRSRSGPEKSDYRKGFRCVIPDMP